MIRRDRYIEQIAPFIGKDIIKVITGIRRSGKSVLLKMLMEDIDTPSKSIYINFESRKNIKLRIGDVLYEEISNRISVDETKWYLFFDEIQEVDGWEEVINSFRVDFDVDIYITGSNAKLLAGELATVISGRYVQFVIYPLSYVEFNQLNGRGFDDYLRLGGMPFVSELIHDESAVELYLEDIYNSVILKDVVKRYNIRDVDLLDRIITYAFDNVGQPFSATSISKYFKSENRKVSTDTVLNYLRFCQEAYLLYQVKRKDIRGKKIFELSEKYYIADHGLRMAILGRSMADIGQVLENIVCIELLRRGYDVTIGAIDGYEIDFVCKKSDETVYIQVTYLMPDKETQEREFGNLLRIKDNFPKFVVSMDGVNMSQKGIKHLHIEEFLKNEW